MRWKESEQPRGRNWMSAMGVLFMVAAVIVALRDLYLITTAYSFGFYLDNYVNAEINNEKFVIGMVVGGAILLYWGFYRKDQGPPDGREWRRAGR